MNYVALEPHPDAGYVRRQLLTSDGTVISTEDVPVNDPDTPPEVANYAALLSKLNGAVAINNAYLALGNPGTAQNTAQVKALTRQVQALVYLLLHQQNGIGSITGT